MREKPTPPADYECCESACSPCVWDTYYDEMEQWRAEQAALKSSAEQAQKDADSAE
ncbi:MAG: oxidoreductase-like domain-containing protein [Pseudomonas sp.]|jgi:cytochrome-b5 reductase|nr:oxidoreductase-like domain-containing protein [Pseudomonas sp.]MDD2224279.1 oxidoreductase-like domain-containing protein [Pseudomonas sp.]MDY0415309.1 oxidoreductase-like domain-containing protein [Pseudomonas sp.]NLO54870.1 hypothetical protein [Gammaproteobacteria bacterium]